MTTKARIAALDALIEAVTAGNLSQRDEDIYAPAIPLPHGDTTNLANVYSAYKCSLDAAKALHDALLPGWVLYRMQWWPNAPDPAVVEIWGTQDGSHSFKDGRSEAKAENPARAWLIAALQAYRASL